jgi:branched-chain amino acid aminotransferase
MNIFVVRDGRLITPDVSQGILEGITRDTIIRLARERLDLPTEERSLDRAELYIADEVFLCGTAAQIAPVTRVDGRAIASGRPGPLTLQFQELYERVVRGRVPGYRAWVEPVYGYSRAPEAAAHRAEEKAEEKEMAWTSETTH